MFVTFQEWTFTPMHSQEGAEMAWMALLLLSSGLTPSYPFF